MKKSPLTDTDTYTAPDVNLDTELTLALHLVHTMEQARRKGGQKRIAKARADGTLMSHIRHMVAMRQAKRLQAKAHKT